MFKASFLEYKIQPYFMLKETLLHTLSLINYMKYESKNGLVWQHYKYSQQSTLTRPECRQSRNNIKTQLYPLPVITAALGLPLVRLIGKLSRFYSDLRSVTSVEL